MALELHIPPCVLKPSHPLHSPPLGNPLRIRIQGPVQTIKKLMPNEPWSEIGDFPQSGGLTLAQLTHDKLYGEGDYEVVDEYLAWEMDGRIPFDTIDYYGVTFDHNVPIDDADPEVLVINIIEVDEPDGGIYADGGKFANEVLLYPIDPREYTGLRVLAVPRCCQRKKGTQDRRLINGLVHERRNGATQNVINGSFRQATGRPERVRANTGNQLVAAQLLARLVGSGIHTLHGLLIMYTPDNLTKDALFSETDLVIMPHVVTEIEIAADPAKVRNMLLDFEKYPEWAKSFIVTIDVLDGNKRDLATGDVLKVTTVGWSFSPVIVKNEPSEFIWRGSLPGIFSGDHRFEFCPSSSPANPGGTLLKQSEHFYGLFGVVMGPTWSMGKSTKAGFERFNDEIKARAESL